MAYDPKATLVPKAIKTLANGDKIFLKLMKDAIQSLEQNKTRRFSDPATSQRPPRGQDNS